MTRLIGMRHQLPIHRLRYFGLPMSRRHRVPHYAEEQHRHSPNGPPKNAEIAKPAMPKPAPRKNPEASTSTRAAVYPPNPANENFAETISVPASTNTPKPFPPGKASCRTPCETRTPSPQTSPAKTSPPDAVPALAS